MIHRVSSGSRLTQFAAFVVAATLTLSGGRLSAGLVGEYAFRAECAVEKVQNTVCNVLSKLNNNCLSGDRSCDGLGIECYRNQCYKRDCDRRDCNDEYQSGDRKSGKQSISKSSKSNNSRGSNNSTQLASVTSKVSGKGSMLKEVLGGKGDRDRGQNENDSGGNSSQKSSPDSKKSSSESKGEGRGDRSLFSKLGNRGKNSEKDSGQGDNNSTASNNAPKQLTSSNAVPKVTSTPAVTKSEPVAVVSTSKPANSSTQVSSAPSIIQPVKPAAESKSNSSSSANNSNSNNSNSNNSSASGGKSIVSSILGGSHGSSSGFGGLFPIDLGESSVKSGVLGSLFGGHDSYDTHDPFCSSSSNCWRDCGILCDILKCDSKLFDKWLCKTLKWSDICDIIPFPCDRYCGGKDCDWFDSCWWKTWFDCHPNGCDWFCCHHHHDCDPDPPCPAVPEPGTLTLAGMALVLGAGAGLKRRRRRGAAAQTSETVG